MGVFRFDQFELDTEAFELRDGGEKVHVEPLVFDLMCFLLSEAGRVVSRDELIEKVWGGRIVSDATISSAIKAMRKALGDSGDNQKYLTTVRGRGFRFDANVEAGDEAFQEAPQTPVGTASKMDPSLAILPFQAYGDDDRLRNTADGLVENLTTILTRIPLLKLSSRMAAAALGEDGVSPNAVRDRLGVSYMIEGSIQHVGDGIRINVQLIDTSSGFHLWAQQFDQPDDGNAIEALLQEILPRLEPQLVKAMLKDLGDQDGGLTSRQLLLQAINILSLKGWNPDSFAQTAGMLRQSTELNPDEALGHAYLALTLALGQRVGMFKRSSEVLEEVFSEVDTALDLDRMDSNVLGLVGCALADVGEPDRGIPILLNAIEANPNNAQAQTALGAAYMLAGEIELAIKHLSQGISMSPMDGRLALWGATLANAHLFAGDLDSALTEAQKSTHAGGNLYVPHIVLAATHLARNEVDNAKQAVDRAYRIAPQLTDRQVAAVVGPKFAGTIEKLWPAPASSGQTGSP